MGSSTSRFGSSPPSGSSRINLTDRVLSALICGGSASSHSPAELEGYPKMSYMSSVDNIAPTSDESQSSMAESFTIFGSELGITSSKTGNEDSSESSDVTTENTIIGLRNAGANRQDNRLLKSKESVSYQASSNYNCEDRFLDRNSDSDRPSTSYIGQSSQSSVFANTRVNLEAVEAHDSIKEKVSAITLEDVHSGTEAFVHGNLCPNGHSVENHGYDAIAPGDSNSGSLTVVSDSVANLRLLGDFTGRVEAPSGLGLLLSDYQQDLRNGSVFHVDLVSISSNILSSSTAEISNREARRNSRRLFWDSLSRRSFRRHINSPTIVFTSDHTEYVGSHDRWLLDTNGDLRYDGVGQDFGYPYARSHHRNDRISQLRSQTSERFLGGRDAGDQQTTCPSGLHLDGTCSCQSFFMADESSAIAGISRIVMLVEALSEVLEEIHRQPFPLSLSMLSLPAPESVVDSFPVMIHKKLDTPENEQNDVQQCYICLAEYAEGDKLRVLPCHHKYHLSCVDKWLKEINRVCPLCRCNVCDGAVEEGLI